MLVCRQDTLVTVEDVELIAFRSVPAPVRADYLRVLDAVVRTVETRWRRSSGVPLLWFTLDATESGVQVTPTSLADLSVHGYLDEFSRWVDGAVAAKTRKHRCAALVHGDRVHARIAFPIGAGWWAPDTFVAVRLHHVDRRLGTYLSLPFTRRGKIFQRLRFDETVPTRLARAQEL
jgi:hypothetical protein